ncbi:MAG: 16S rRNA (uracil(1498)-N(3))-methyltransferase [Candidatus Scalindua sp. AMX11]|nr:MAG: 16S rRNA (uracil(1498)-N(3))-methyltransferase [Candidatus Scalindua sp.]NOG85204.1 16S rRNA (uracil(1498)-N(3))-methyltransferase [Planctomycetota bacterium]RZV66148.1 MAG: 16S rRNA (uracil(1498)-N(3))-methyltransferase [Candidatus Scalindua sp. SCAELEC01]TDE63543.1 MAG: 16S rRNA (uracil(1498)-N(3))-methyltransferase [Candidatus Scalindua sp. AMX11]GJQ60877.1 MAG: ribosomal RNA small subunit methyltransferase E [Candidatus Scalindua sp.]
MNLILLNKHDFVEGSRRVHIRDNRKKHILNVTRSSVGDELRVGLLGGDVGKGRITYISQDLVEMEVVFDQRPPAPLSVTLVLAMVRPGVFKRVLVQVSALGIKNIVVINSRRVEKSFWKSRVLETDSLYRYLIMGLEQGQDTIVPKVMVRPRFKPFVEDELPGMIKGTIPFLAHPYASKKCPYNVGGPVTLVVGPEGGFVEYEIKKLIECGFTAVHLGARTLTVESAISGLVSRLS